VHKRDNPLETVDFKALRMSDSPIFDLNWDFLHIFSNYQENA